jgi:hypothetical protein
MERETERETSGTYRDAGEATSDQRGQERKNLGPNSVEPRSILEISRTKRGHKKGGRGREGEAK